jgi:hypothetical protein
VKRRTYTSRHELGKAYFLEQSGSWAAYLECPDGEVRRFITAGKRGAKASRRPVSQRFSVLARDNYTCRYCGRSAPEVTLHVDHIIPVAEGGTDEPANLVTACADCNEGKGPRHAGGIADPPATPAPDIEKMRAAMSVLLPLYGGDGLAEGLSTGQSHGFTHE